jgi:pimeloyl-ACP methyl ester carboxylesterase
VRFLVLLVLGKEEFMENVDQAYTTSSVTSKDGTLVSYRRMGNGPGVVLLHGAMMSSQLFMKLGTALSDSFTVYIPNRRGRGSSGPFGDEYGIKKEIEDLEAILEQTHAHNVFGLSAGALITLEAALRLPVISKAALYEPPLNIDNSIPAVLPFMTRLDGEIAEGRMADAMATFTKNFAKYFERRLLLLSLLPHPILSKFFARVLRNDAKNVKSGDVPFQALLPTFRYDIQLILDTAGTLETFKGMRAEVLLLGGSESPTVLKRTLDALSKILPNAKRVELQGVGHEAPTDRGQPERIAPQLRRFFGDSSN